MARSSADKARRRSSSSLVESSTMCRRRSAGSRRRVMKPRSEARGAGAPPRGDEGWPSLAKSSWAPSKSSRSHWGKGVLGRRAGRPRHRVVTYRAEGDDSSGEVTPKLPRSSVVVGGLQEPASGRRGPKAGASYRSFGTVSPTCGRWKASYVGPDRRRHTAGVTFSNQVRAQGWFANELGLIERGEWTPPAERRRQVEAAALTFDEFARDWIDRRLVRGRPLKDRTREHYLDWSSMRTSVSASRRASRAASRLFAWWKRSTSFVVLASCTRARTAVPPSRTTSHSDKACCNVL